MADQMQIEKAVTGIHDKVEGYTSSITSYVEGYGGQIAQWAKDLLDRFFPPEQRAAFLAKIQEFMLANPKVSAFLGMNIALTGIPLGLFILFSFSVGIFSLIVGILLGIGAAVLFTLFVVGVAFSALLPTILFTTTAAGFLFLWGLGGYYFLQWANGPSEGNPEKKPLLESGSIGGSLNSLTGGRLTGFMDSAKADKAKGDISGFSDKHTPPKPTAAAAEKEKTSVQQANSPAPREKQNVGLAKVTTPTLTVQKATKAPGINGVSKTAASTTGTVKGGLGGATGLA